MKEPIGEDEIFSNAKWQLWLLRKRSPRHDLTRIRKRTEELLTWWDEGVSERDWTFKNRRKKC